MNDQTFELTLKTFARHVNTPYVDFLRRLGLDREFVRAEGALVFDQDGRPFVDCIAGYGNLNLGHNPPEVIAAVVEEFRSLRPFNWPFVSSAHARLAERLAKVTAGELECTLVVNSGAEAVDSALKLVRLVTGKSNLIAMQGAWHGFTMGALSVSEPSLCHHFGPLLDGVTRVPFGKVDAVREALTPDIGAVIVEPIQAESGVIVPPAGYLSDLAALCRRRGVILIFDEIKTGVGKTGRFLACEHDNVVPDLLLLGKSLGGGIMPIGAVVARKKLWGAFGYNFAMSSSSGAGNAPACAAALAVLEVLEAGTLCEQVARKGEWLLRELNLIAKEFPAVVTGVSGRGLMIALHTDRLKTANAVVTHCIANGVLVVNAFGDRTRILIEPPFCITTEQLEKTVAVLRESMTQIAARSQT